MNPQVLTEEEIKSAKRLYEQGATLKELGEKFDVYFRTISKWLKRYGTDVNNKALTSKERKRVVELYQSGSNSIEIAKKFPVNDVTIRNILERHDIERRPSPETKKKYQLDKDVFKEKNPENSYWIGFLLADGCIHDEEEWQDIISLAVQQQDRKLLEKFRKFLKTDQPIYENRDNKGNMMYSLRIRSQQLVDDLERFGIIPRKTSVADPRNINNRDFWRGEVDGDGTLCLSAGYATLALYGTRQVCKKFRNFVKDFCKTEASVLHSNSTYQFKVVGKYACKMTEVLYKDSEVYLDRKYKLAKQFF